MAISPQLAATSAATRTKSRLDFDILNDHGNAYAAQLGLRFALPADLRQVYLGFGNDLAVRNGEPSWTLAMPARFVIDRRGIVRAVDADPDYTRRPEPTKTLADVRGLA